MKQVREAAKLIVCLYLISVPVASQSLFESSQSGSHEELVSNNFTLGGFLQSAAYLSEHPETEEAFLQSAYALAGLKLDMHAGERASAYCDLRFRYGSEFGRDLSEITLREAWAELWAGPLSLRMGKFILPWGKTSVFNPVDKMNPKNPLERSPEEDDMQLGIWGLQGSIRLGSSMKFTAIWNPVYQASTLLIDPVPVPTYVIFSGEEHPGFELREGNYGLSYDITSTFADLSLYWFQGYHHWPGIHYKDFSMDSISMEPAELILAEKAYRIKMAGLDFSIPMGSIILRCEGAWSQSMEDPRTQEYLPFPELSYSAEIERSGNNLSLIGGYHGKYILDYLPLIAEPSLDAGMDEFLPLQQMGVLPSMEQMDVAITGRIGAFNRLYNYQVDELYHSVYAVLRIFAFYEKLEVTIPVIYHTNTEEWIVQPGIRYKPADGLALYAGFSGLFGPEQSLHDMVGPTLNAGYLAIKFSF